jgi:hypothetical protein
LSDPDLIENVAAAADRSRVPVTTWHGQAVQLMGPPPSAGVRDALGYVLERAEVRAQELAAAHKLSIANASGKLRQLWEGGYLMRGGGTMPSGGTEYLYRRIG